MTWLLRHLQSSSMCSQWGSLFKTEQRSAQVSKSACKDYLEQYSLALWDSYVVQQLWCFCKAIQLRNLTLSMSLHGPIFLRNAASVQRNSMHYCIKWSCCNQKFLWERASRDGATWTINPIVLQTTGLVKNSPCWAKTFQQHSSIQDIHLPVMATITTVRYLLWTVVLLWGSKHPWQKKLHKNSLTKHKLCREQSACKLLYLW